VVLPLLEKLPDRLENEEISTQEIALLEEGGKVG
jgi:hypothetical protein